MCNSLFLLFQLLTQPADTTFVKAIAQTLSTTLQYYTGSIPTQILYSTTDLNHSATDLNKLTADPNHSTTDPNDSTTDFNQSTTDPKLISSCGHVKMKGYIETVEKIETIEVNSNMSDIGEEHNLCAPFSDAGFEKASLELSHNRSEPELTKSNTSITCEQMEISDHINGSSNVCLSDQHAGGDICVWDKSMALQVKCTCTKQGSTILDKGDRSHVGGQNHALRVKCVVTKHTPNSPVLEELPREVLH